jgi:hypothetical protein
MRIEITRRELAAALSGLSAAAWIGMPALAVEAATPVPMPPACRSGGIAPQLIDDVHDLYRLASEEWRACSKLEQTGRGGFAWSRLYVMKVDAASALRGRLGHLTSDELALRGWLAAIYQTKLSAVARSDELFKVSPSLKGAAVAFQKQLLRLPFPGQGVSDSPQSIPPDATALQATHKGATQAAWAMLRIEPRTACDAALHRRAAMFVADRNVARFLKARWAGIVAA